MQKRRQKKHSKLTKREIKFVFYVKPTHTTSHSEWHKIFRFFHLPIGIDESLGIEIFWIDPQFRIHMNAIYKRNYMRTSRYYVSIEVNISRIRNFLLHKINEFQSASQRTLLLRKSKSVVYNKPIILEINFIHIQMLFELNNQTINIILL